VLLDAEMDSPVVQEVQEVIEVHFPSAAMADLHVWRVGKGHYARILALVSDETLDASVVCDRLAVYEEVAHVTVEVIRPSSGAQLRFASRGG
jgi:Co/Zn/Cd efflux system component